MIGLDSEVQHLPVHVVFAFFSEASNTAKQKQSVALDVSLFSGPD